MSDKGTLAREVQTPRTLAEWHLDDPTSRHVEVSMTTREEQREQKVCDFNAAQDTRAWAIEKMGNVQRSVLSDALHCDGGMAHLTGPAGEDCEVPPVLADVGLGSGVVWPEDGRLPHVLAAYKSRVAYRPIEQDRDYLVSISGSPQARFRPPPILVTRDAVTELIRLGAGDCCWRVVYHGGLGALAFVRLAKMAQPWRGRRWRPFPHEVRVRLQMYGMILSDELFGHLIALNPFNIRIMDAIDNIEIVPVAPR
jgi:hypothetical protein